MILLALTPRLAEAHKLIYPKTIRLGVRGDELALAVNYDVDAGDSAQLMRRLFDRNADGRLDADEQGKILELLERTANLWLTVKIDGQKRALHRAERRGFQLDLPADATQNLGVALLYTTPLPPWRDGRILRIELVDRDQDAAKVVPVTVDLPSGAEVRLSSLGELHPRLHQIHRVMLAPERGLRLELAWVKSATAAGP